jgi:9-cis-epoxycarotenoid dioxygenase
VAKTNTSRTATERAGASTSQSQARPHRHSAPAVASLPMALCIVLEEAINTFVVPPALRPSVGPQNVLSANWAPVDKLPSTPCTVMRGAIPRCLVGGAYIRNGPNSQHLPRGPHQLLDGDGMLTLCSSRRRTLSVACPLWPPFAPNEPTGSKPPS